MISIFKKEVAQFFSSLTGYLAIAVFLLLMGLFLFIFPDTSIFDYGYATLDKFFDLAPYILLLLVPAITMRSFSEEFKTGTWELLKTKSISAWQIVTGKYLAALAVVLLTLLPTVIYVFTIYQLSINQSIDSGAIMGSYFGLVFLVAVFTAIGLFCSTLTNNGVVAFLLASFVCFAVYMGFGAVSKMPGLQGGADYWIESLSIDTHYLSMSRGVLELKDVAYFIIVPAAFLLFAKRNIVKK